MRLQYQHHHNRTQGFTLIEMLFVIAILAVIAALSIMTYRRHAENTRIDKTALEMQQVLEAALSYKTSGSSGDWPSNNLQCEDKHTEDFVNHYIPNDQNTSVYGGYYCWGKTDNQLFWVAAKVPNKIIADRIAARLPNAIDIADPKDQGDQIQHCDSTGDCYVRAEIGQPSFQHHGNSFAGAGYCVPNSTDPGNKQDACWEHNNPGDTVFKYTVRMHCPQSTDQGIVVATPNFYSLSINSYVGGMIGKYSCALDSQNVFRCSSQPLDTACKLQADGSYLCNVYFQAIIGDHKIIRKRSDYSGVQKYYGDIGASYIAYCKPKKSLQRLARF